MYRVDIISAQAKVTVALYFVKYTTSTMFFIVFIFPYHYGLILSLSETSFFAGEGFTGEIMEGLLIL